MFHEYSPVKCNTAIKKNIHLINIHSPKIASKVKPGQFINIKISSQPQPFFRRPFSVHYVSGENIEIIFKVIGPGTTILSSRKEGDLLDIIGPLGTGFKITDDYETALLVGGGLGIAPLPLVHQALNYEKKECITFLGARTDAEFICSHLGNINIATDDGSRGFKGTVVDLLAKYLKSHRHLKPKIFGCGPIAMLEKLKNLARQYLIPCEISLEKIMACGIGLCQGCVIENLNSDNKYSLICKNGPVFNANNIKLENNV